MLSVRSKSLTFVLLMAVLAAIVGFYSVAFHVLMVREGGHHSWLTGLYWTMQTMSTLGYGDVTFQSDLGRAFTVVVLVTGIMILFIFLPFTLIQFFYAPWLEARSAARAPRELTSDFKDHVLLTAHGPVEAALIQRLRQFRTPYAVIVPEVAQALALHDQGVPVMVGKLDDADTYRRARVAHASLVAATLSDTMNATIALTVREASSTVPLVATAGWEISSELLRSAGCQQVVQLGEMLGRSMARRIAGQDGRSHVVGQLDDLVIAEAAAANTALVGRSIRELELRDRLNVNVAGVWDRGRYLVGAPDVVIQQDSVLLLSGTRQHLDAYDRDIRVDRPSPNFVLVVGGGRVGRATSRSLAELGIDHRVIERKPDRARDRAHAFTGDATDPDVLVEAGIDRAVSVAITTREDDVNVYVALLCRQLRPNVQILSRATLERNVSTLYNAGADLVLSYVPMEANAIFGVLRRGNLLLLAEGLDLFTVPVPKSLIGRTIASSGLREHTGCNVLAVRGEGGRARLPEPNTPLAAGTHMVLIGDRKAAGAFFTRYDVRVV